MSIMKNALNQSSIVNATLINYLLLESGYWIGKIDIEIKTN